MIIIPFIIKNNYNKYYQCGYGNGYVILPPGHRYYGVDYEHIECSVHGGLTFSKSVKDIKHTMFDFKSHNIEDGWVIGFDTCHYNDSLENFPKSRVIEEVMNLKKQMYQVKNKRN